jgi:transcriptional regulator with XRE-family HTH domain
VSTFYVYQPRGPPTFHALGCGSGSPYEVGMRKPTQQQLGRRLAELRKRAKLTQGAAAEKLGIADETLSRLERGTQWTDFETLVALCDLYDADWSELVPARAARSSAQQSAIQRVVDVLRDLPQRDIDLILGLAKEVASRSRSSGRP